MHFPKLGLALALLLIVTSIDRVSAQVATPELDACRSTGLIAIRERNPSIKDVAFDFDDMTVAKANTKVEDTLIKKIVIGDAYLEKSKKDIRQRPSPKLIKAEVPDYVRCRSKRAEI
jgi:hypothetical protein